MKETKTAKEKRKEISEAIIGIILFIGFIFFITWIGARPSVLSKSFCEELGFSKATDEYTNRLHIVGVECDKKYIFNVCERKECISKDKWGNCDSGYYLEIQNNTLMGDCD